eukprot:SAG11_NODE_31206_length_293_cov_8.664948_1_plen_33_part_01
MKLYPKSSWKIRDGQAIITDQDQNLVETYERQF